MHLNVLLLRQHFFFLQLVLFQSLCVLCNKLIALSWVWLEEGGLFEI